MFTYNHNTHMVIVKTTAPILGQSNLMVIPNLSSIQDYTSDRHLDTVGAKESYTPQIGTLVSTMNWLRNIILQILWEK